MKLDSLYLDRDRTGQGATLFSTAVAGQQGRILCTIYTVGGQGMHPVLIFTHGYPGHEKNLDLAQSLRRMGFHSVVFFYRGSWGSAGRFSFNGSIKDTQAVLDFVLTDTQHGFDKTNIFFIGHSLGCLTAARMIALYPEDVYKRQPEDSVKSVYDVAKVIAQGKLIPGRRTGELGAEEESR